MSYSSDLEELPQHLYHVRPHSCKNIFRRICSSLVNLSKKEEELNETVKSLTEKIGNLTKSVGDLTERIVVLETTSSQKVLEPLSKPPTPVEIPSINTLQP